MRSTMATIASIAALVLVTACDRDKDRDDDDGNGGGGGYSSEVRQQVDDGTLQDL